MQLPPARGPLSEAVADLLGRPADEPALTLPPHPEISGLADEDGQLALWCCYELHYRGFDGVDEAWEWSPDLLAFRAGLERSLLAVLADEVPREEAPTSRDLPEALFRLAAEDDGPPLSTYLAREAELDQYREFAMHRSVYHLKEADPHTFQIPRLAGTAKAALVEVQSDEYGGGRPERMHAALFGRVLRGLGLSDGYGDHVPVVPGGTLAVSTVMSLFGLHRRWRGAAAGHLAALEMTSSIPNRRYGDGLRRLGLDDGTALFFDEHVQADAVHEQIAARDLCGALAAAEPGLAGDVLWGAACCLAVESAAGRPMLDAWRAGRSSLLQPAGV